MASFCRRLAAWIIDGVILGIIIAAVSRIGGAGWILAYVIPVAYFVLPYPRVGQTPGKMILGIEVSAADGGPLKWRKRILRYFGYFISGPPFALGFLWSIWDRNKQAWHDKMAGTVVVMSSDQAWGIDPVEARRSQRRWLLGLGVPSVLIVTVAAIWIWFFFPVDLSEVSEMGPWPSSDAHASRTVGADLGHLGFAKGDIERVPVGAKPGLYEDGAAVTYFLTDQPVAAVWVLKYVEESVASQAFDLDAMQM